MNGNNDIDGNLENEKKPEQSAGKDDFMTNDPEGSFDFTASLEKGFDIYKNNLAPLILAGIIASLLSLITVGILAGPMVAGLYIMTLKAHEGESVELGDLFNGFQHFLPTLLFVIVWGLISVLLSFVFGMVPFVGHLLSTAVSFALGTGLMFGIPLIVDRNMEFWDASMESINKVKPFFGPLLGLYVVASLIGAAGVILCGIGVFLTASIPVCIYTAAYRSFYPKNI